MPKRSTAAPPDRLSKALAAALPAPKQSRARTVRVLVALSEGERDAIAAVAESRDEPLAATVRILAVTYAEQILGAKGR